MTDWNAHRSTILALIVGTMKTGTPWTIDGVHSMVVQENYPVPIDVIKTIMRENPQTFVRTKDLLSAPPNDADFWELIGVYKERTKNNCDTCDQPKIPEDQKYPRTCDDCQELIKEVCLVCDCGNTSFHIRNYMDYHDSFQYICTECGEQNY